MRATEGRERLIQKKEKKNCSLSLFPCMCNKEKRRNSNKQNNSAQKKKKKKIIGKTS